MSEEAILARSRLGVPFFACLTLGERLETHVVGLVCVDPTLRVCRRFTFRVHVGVTWGPVRGARVSRWQNEKTVREWDVCERVCARGCAGYRCRPRRSRRACTERKEHITAVADGPSKHARPYRKNIKRTSRPTRHSTRR